MFAPLTFVGSCNRVWHDSGKLLTTTHYNQGKRSYWIKQRFINQLILKKMWLKHSVKSGIYQPLSPDLNKIERWWFVLKNWIRQRLKEFEDFRDCVDAAFIENLRVFP